MQKFLFMIAMCLCVSYTERVYAEDQEVKCEGVTYLMSISDKKELYRVEYPAEGGAEAKLTLIAKLDRGGHLAALPGSQMIYTVDNDQLWTFNLETTETEFIGYVRTEEGTEVKSMHQMGFAPDGTLYGSSSSLDRLYKVDLLTAAAIDLGRVRAPAGSELEFLDISGGDLVFKQDGTMFVFGRAGGPSNERSIYIVKEGTAGLYAEFFSGPYDRSTGLSILDGGKGDFVVSLYQKGVAVVDANTGEIKQDVALFLNEEQFLPGWGDMSNACVEINPTPKYTGSIFFKPHDCPVITDKLGDETKEYLFKEKDGEDLLAEAFKSNGISLVNKDGSDLSTGSMYFDVDSTGFIYEQEYPSLVTDQLQIQRFYTPDEVTLKMQFFGPKKVDTENNFGVYYYEKGGETIFGMSNNDGVKFKRLISQKDDEPGTTVEFTIPSNHYFGFYLTKTLYGYTNYYYSENRFNSDVGYVGDTDQQRPGKLTDHFVFYDTKQGMVLSVEDSSLIEGGYLLGEQSYSDFMMGFFSCKDARLIDPVDNGVDTGVPSDSGSAGLESYGQLNRGYAMRDILGIHNVATHNKPKSTLGLHGETPIISGIRKVTSPIANFFKNIFAGLNLFHHRDGDEQSLKDLIATLPSASSHNWLGKAEDRTPFDIPFISNALSAVGLTYVKDQQDHAGVFASITESKVYNHSKGICDRTHGSVVSAINYLDIDGGKFTLAKIENSLTNQRDYAILFSIYVNTSGQAVVHSHWLADDYRAADTGEKVFNYQIWSHNTTTSRNMVWEILKNFKSKYTLTYATDAQVTPHAFIRRAQLSGNFVNIEFQNNLENPYEVTVQTPYMRYGQGADRQSADDRILMLAPGISKFRLAYDQSLFDLLLYVKGTDVHWRDSIYLQRGSYTYVLDGGKGGSSHAVLTHDCDLSLGVMNVDPLYTSTDFNGCATLAGSRDIFAGLYRTLKSQPVSANDTLSFQYKSNQDLQLCLHFAGQETPRQCTRLQASARLQNRVLKLTEVLSAEALKASLPKVKAVEFSPVEKGAFSLHVQGLQVRSLKHSLELTNFARIDNITPIEDLIAQLGVDYVSIWSWESGSWHYWSNDPQADLLKKHFDGPLSRLTTIDPNKAYWVHIHKSQAHKLARFAGKSPRSLPKDSGWHLVSNRETSVQERNDNIWMWSMKRLLKSETNKVSYEEQRGFWLYQQD